MTLDTVEPDDGLKLGFPDLCILAICAWFPDFCILAICGVVF